MSDLILLLVILLVVSGSLSIFLLISYFKTKKALELAEFNKKLFEEIFHRLPVEAILIKDAQILKLNQKALENLGGNPTISEIKKNLHRKGKKFDVFEINLDSQHKILILSDITERESLREAYQIALSYLSHELKTPFAIAYGYLERLDSLLQRKTQDNEIMALYEKTKESFQRLEKLLKKLFSSIDYLAKEIRIKRESLKLKEIIEEALFWVTPLAEQKQVKMELNLEEDIFLEGSSELLTQAFFNILENAVKASPEGEKVYIKALPYNFKHILITIRDKGPGVIPEKLPLLGMPFFKLRESEGMGLGLFITKRIIEAHGGELKFNLPKERGLEVQVFLPIR
ncbi:MAG: HAMP domain-containing histidine kinase [Caldimicrobium sp.]|nr:HAMP domain-containing histidine kinase [Caldimicrobium sp.]MCX7613133.1 HAMP domain-containing histidine kinase [Caldimicrobium sp.]MDW8183260.1 HAMP domain-containing sensor histidine kinase [Caldimicrobium sp.]